MRYPHKIFVAAILVGLSGLVVTCSIYDASLLIAAASDAGVEAGDAGVLDAGTTDGFVDPCPHFGPPPPPATEDGTGDVDFVLATSFLRVLPNGNATTNHPQAPVGFDLDHACTCPAPESCTPRDIQKHCDGDGGTDDSTGSLFETFAEINPAFSDDGINASVRQGLYTLLYRVRSYNGGKNDKQVSFIVYASNGTDPVEDGGPATVPRYDGTDVWTIDANSLIGGGAALAPGLPCEGHDNACIPKYVDTEAYVTNGVLVAHLDFPIGFGSGDVKLEVTLSSTDMVLPLIFDGTSYRVDEGVITGRWSTTGLLTSLETSPDPLGAPGTFLCGDSGTYQAIKTKTCAAADVMADPTKDGLGEKCNALSFAMSFSATPARLGPIYDPGTGGTPACGASYQDDCP